MANILKLVPPSPPSDGTGPDKDVIAQLRLLLELAEEGNITSLAYTAIGDPDEAPAVGFSGEHKNALIAGTQLLARAILWQPVP